MKNYLTDSDVFSFSSKPLLFLIVFSIVFYGCSAAPAPESRQEKVSQAVEGTIASICELDGYADAPVQGYGVVCGLRETGSRDCPTSLKDYILAALRTPEVRQAMGPYYRQFKAEEIFRSRSTAVVQVNGAVPAGAPKGKSFDVQVTVLPATQTTSLQGGKLLPCELRTVAAVGQRPIAGRSVAIASGPIFINPFPTGRKDDQLRHADPRQGRVIGGAMSLKDRQIELLLAEPSWRQATRIQNRINSRFSNSDGPDVAVGLSRSAIRVQIPRPYQDRYNHFIAMLMTLYLSEDPAFLLTKLDNLAALAREDLDDADFESLCVSWEAIGKEALLSLLELYQNHQGKTQFYAARTALDLGDLAALGTVVQISQDAGHPCQSRAVQALHRYVERPTARRALLNLVDGSDVSLRLLAYEGLRKANDVIIDSFRIKRGFWLDVVETQGDHLLCIWTSQSPRIILFGETILCRNNIFFESSHQPLTINAGGADNELTIIRNIDEGLITVRSAPNAADLILKMSMPPHPQPSGEAGGAGLSFSEIAGVLYEMCQEEQAYIQAQFELHNERSG